MRQVNRWLRQSSKMRFALALLPLATVSAVLTATAHTVRADETRVCQDYGVVRDRSDYEAPLLPRQSVAHCARSYQTLYQTYRVRPESPNSGTNSSNSNTNSVNPSAENPAPAPATTDPTTGTNPATGETGSSTNTYVR
jgi:hypothetical protein